jgi:hypothetical protein
MPNSHYLYGAFISLPKTSNLKKDKKLRRLLLIELLIMIGIIASIMVLIIFM